MSYESITHFHFKMITEQWVGNYNTRQDQEKRQYQVTIFEIILLKTDTHTRIHTLARAYTNSVRHKRTYAHISHPPYVYLRSTKFNHQGLSEYTGYKQMEKFTTKKILLTCYKIPMLIIVVKAEVT